ncbi:MAG: alpha/beta fold hydrolase [Rickettsiales bacterium]|jgi:alpha/beta superfamily hydrolase|nr:alpha/beta fold hydrolase [Rickettsiales bacterium]
MVDVIINGEVGKLHAVYNKADGEATPLAVVFSGNPRAGFHMNDRVSYALFRAFMDAGFSVVRFDYRGVGDSDGTLGTTQDNMIDIATVIDWIQNQNEDSDKLWLAGNHTGAWYASQVMMRRPEVSGFVLVSPDNNVSDFSFLSPRPNRGLMIQGAGEPKEALDFGQYMVQLLRKQAQISTEILLIKDSDAQYATPADIKKLYNEAKAYIGRENEENKLL